jgi:hypothetical protein
LRFPAGKIYDGAHLRGLASPRFALSRPGVATMPIRAHAFAQRIHQVDYIAWFLFRLRRLDVAPVCAPVSARHELLLIPVTFMRKLSDSRPGSDPHGLIRCDQAKPSFPNGPGPRHAPSWVLSRECMHFSIALRSQSRAGWKALQLVLQRPRQSRAVARLGSHPGGSSEWIARNLLLCAAFVA